MRGLVFLAVFGFALSCSPDAEIKKKVGFACKHLLLSTESLDAIPENVAIEEYVRSEDVKFIQQKNENVTGGLAAAMIVAMKPAAKALAQARSEATNCTLGEVVREGGAATVKVKEESPKMEMSLVGGLEKMGDLAKADSSDARLIKAKALLATAKENQTLEHEVTVLKTDSGWRVNLRLPEKAKEEELKRNRTSAAKVATDAAMAASRLCDIALARSKLSEAKKLMPELAEIHAWDDAIDSAAEDCIGGKWQRSIEDDPMTDDINVTIMLQSDNEIEGRFSTRYRGQLVGRCKEKQLEFFVATKQMLHDTYDVGIVARYRFGEQKAERVVLSRSSDYEAGFFAKPREWLSRLSAHKDDVLILELPISNEAPVVFRFNLDGVEKVSELLSVACKVQ